MGYFKNISFTNFRNFKNFSLDFSNSLNIIIGKNGSGKTNILEGISLTEKGRGFRKEVISNFINFTSLNKKFEIYSNFINENNEYNVKVFNSEKNLKKLNINNNSEVDSIKHFESLFSIIYFLPEMERLFLASPSFRRNFFDRLIFTTYKDYNLIINSYKKAIYDRQLLLKKDSYDETWITNIEGNIVKFGSIIYKKRILHLEIINKIIEKLNYKNHFSKNFILKIQDEFLEQNLTIYDNDTEYLKELKNKRRIDTYAGGCSIGPHRSNIVGFNRDTNFNLNQLSTGQQKTVVLLIIISQCYHLINNLKITPIILLDEICSHLDEANRELLLYLVNRLSVQTFMTGNEENLFSFLSTKAHYCNIVPQ